VHAHTAYLTHLLAAAAGLLLVAAAVAVVGASAHLLRLFAL
jgi:hypothetical protein